MRKTKLVAKVKVIKRIIIIFSIIFCIICFEKISFSNNNKTEIQYEEICVEYGDSLWSIACYEQENNPYFKNKDVREVIYQIKKINKLSNCNLYANQTLKIPVL